MISTDVCALSPCRQHPACAQTLRSVRCVLHPPPNVAHLWHTDTAHLYPPSQHPSSQPPKQFFHHSIPTTFEQIGTQRSTHANAILDFCPLLTVFYSTLSHNVQYNLELSSTPQIKNLSLSTKLMTLGGKINIGA